MKISVIYYLAQIKEAYPEITDIKREEYEKISAEINAQMQAGQPLTAHKQLYSKTYRFLKILANFYAEKDIDYRSFNDNLSALQLKIMENLNNRVAKKDWFPNFKSYISAISHYYCNIINIYEKENKFQEQLSAKLVGNLLKDEVNKQVYEKELKNVEINETKVFLNETLNTLTPRQAYVIREYYGLNGNERTLKDIGSDFYISKARICQLLNKALVKLRHPSRAEKLYDFYKFDSDQ